VPQCPVCNSAVSLETTPTLPFCSDRCRLIDLGRWLEEGYSVPHVARDDDEEGEEGLVELPGFGFDEDGDEG